MSDYVLVPRIADDAMTDQGALYNSRGMVWSAMLAARPPHCDDLLKAMEECESAAKKRVVRGHDVNCKALHRVKPRLKCDCGQDELLDALSRLSTLRSQSTRKET